MSIAGSDAPIAEMTCEECEDLLPLVADGVLDEADDPSLFHHFGAARAARHHWRRMIKSIYCWPSLTFRPSSH